jgi:hypothetical protein
MKLLPSSLSVVPLNPWGENLLKSVGRFHGEGQPPRIGRESRPVNLQPSTFSGTANCQLMAGCVAHVSTAQELLNSQALTLLNWKESAIYRRAFFRNFNPFTAISSRVGSIRRQMAAARAITFTSVVNDSMTTSPLYLMSRRALAMDFQSM